MVRKAIQTLRVVLGRLVKLGGDRVGFVLAFGLSFVAYFHTLAPTVATVFDDSLELQLVAFQPGIAHPTGYPLYTLLGKLFTFLPLGDVAYRVNLMSAVFGALTVGLVFLVCRRLGCRWLPAQAGAMVFAFSPTFWSQCVIAEVYSLNAFFLAGTVYLLLTVGASSTASASGEAAQAASQECHPWRGLYLVAFFYGLSLTHHRTMVLLLPGMLLYLWLQRKNLGQMGRLPVGRLTLSFLSPLLLYLYIPLRGMVMSSLDGTYQNSLQGFLTWVTGSSYTLFLGDNPLARESQTAAFLLGTFLDQYGYLGLAAGAIGVLWLLLRNGRYFVLVAGALAVYSAFAFSYRVADVEVFYIPAFLFFAIAIGCGFSGLWTWADEGGRGPTRREALTTEGVPGERERGRPGIAAWGGAMRWFLAACCVVASLVVPADALRRSFAREDMSENWTAHEYGQEILRQPMEQGAAIVGILGETTLLRYFQQTEGLRTDLVLVAADREQERLGAITSLLSSGTPVYLTRPLAGVDRQYSLASFGPLIKVLSAPLQEPPVIRVPRLVDFSGQATLLGYSVNEAPGVQPTIQPRTFSSRAGQMQEREPEGVEAGKRLGVTLYWRCSQATSEDYKVSLRLVDATGRLVSQQDSLPINDAYPTTSWRKGEVVVDTHYLHVPLGTAPGEYILRVGLYSANLPNGLKAYDGKTQATVVDLGTVHIARPNKPPSLDGLPARVLQQSGRPALPGWTESESLASLGVSSVVRGNFDNQITLFGYGLSRDPLKPGEGAEVILLWQAERDIDADYVVFLQLVGADGKIWTTRDSAPVSGQYPTSRWIRNEIVRDTHTLLLPADMPNGDYALQVGLYRSTDAQRLTVLRWTRRSTDVLDLAKVAVKGRDRAFTAPVVSRTQTAQFGRFIKFLGYDLSLEKDQANAKTLRLKLYYQALAPMDRSYTVFTHLLDAGSKIWAQEDSQPLHGLAPTTTWLPGEYLADEYALQVRPNAPAGEYALEIGFYDASTNQRLSVLDAQGMPLGDRVILKDQVILGP